MKNQRTEQRRVSALSKGVSSPAYRSVEQLRNTGLLVSYDTQRLGFVGLKFGGLGVTAEAAYPGTL